MRAARELELADLRAEYRAKDAAKAADAARKRPSECELQIRAAAVAASYGEPEAYCPDPREPSEAEALYLEAREHFRAGRQCAGWDAVERADAASGFDQG